MADKASPFRRTGRLRSRVADRGPITPFVLPGFVALESCPHCGGSLACCSVTHCRTGHSSLTCDGIAQPHSHQKCYRCGWERVTLRAT